MVYVALVLLTLVAVAACAWTARREVRTDGTLPCSTDRLGIREASHGPPVGR